MLTGNVQSTLRVKLEIDGSDLRRLKPRGGLLRSAASIQGIKNVHTPISQDNAKPEKRTTSPTLSSETSQVAKAFLSDAELFPEYQSSGPIV